MKYKNRYLPIYIIFSFFIFSCKNPTLVTKYKESEKDTVVSNNTILKDSIFSPKEYSFYTDTIKINYMYNQEILKILPLIPDESMDTWKWTKEDREAFVNSIKTNNYWIDNDPQYPISLNSVFQHSFTSLVKDNSCNSELEEISPYFEYHFDNKNEINVYYPVENKHCYAGNFTTYKFNKEQKKFIFSSIEG